MYISLRCVTLPPCYALKQPRVTLPLPPPARHLHLPPGVGGEGHDPQAHLHSRQPIRTVPPPDGLVRGACRKLAIHEWFTNGVLAVIFLNAIALAVIHRGMSDEFSDGLEWANVAFAAVFAFEA